MMNRVRTHRRTTMLLLYLLASLLIGACATQQTAEPAPAQADPLPSWNDGPSRQAITAFVDAVTDPASPDFRPEAERVAVFDNDGTLWSENPFYFQMYFVLYQIRTLAPSKPEWQEIPAVQAVMTQDLHTVLSRKDINIRPLFGLTHTGMTTAELTGMVESWLAEDRHPTSGRPFTEMIFQPMLELLDYLRANGFETYIVSGGGQGFMRPWTEATYGIPPQNVVGTSFKLEYQSDSQNPQLNRMADLAHYNDKGGKPVGIQQHIGRRPIFAAGNSDGDYEMLEWTTTGPGRTLGVYVHHTDAEREWAYDRGSKVGALERGLDNAQDNGWILIDMKNEWSVIYPPEG